MNTKKRMGLVVTAVAVLLIAGLFWLMKPHPPETESLTAGGSTGVAVLPSDGGGEAPSKPAPSTSPVEDVSPATGEETVSEPSAAPTDAEKTAREFMSSFPGDVESLADPTFLASLDDVDASLLEQVADLDIEEVDRATDEAYERHAFTVSGTYLGELKPIYTIVVARPTEPGEGDSTGTNDLPFQVHSFDWSPGMLGNQDSPGPAAGFPSPITAQQRADLIDQTRTDVIEPVLTVEPGETPEQRLARLEPLAVEPITVMPPMSRSGRYAMTTEILSEAYSTEPGGPITITYTGTWVDPYDPSRNGAWALTATPTRSDNGTFAIHRVE